MHYYKFKIADYRKNTMHLNPLEHYIYRSLIDLYYMDEKPIPKKTQWVIRRLGLGSGWNNMGYEQCEKYLKNVLDDYFLDTEDGFLHVKIEEDLKQYKKTSNKNRENGKKGGRPKKLINQQLSEISETQTKPNGNPKKPSGFRVGTQSEPTRNPNHKPITNNQEKKEKKLKNKEKKVSSENDQEYLTAKGKKLTGQNLKNFEIFWETFDYKKSKSSAADSWLKIPWKKSSEPDAKSCNQKIFESILKSAEFEAQTRQAKILTGQIPKMAQGWLTERRWEDPILITQVDDISPPLIDQKTNKQRVAAAAQNITDTSW